MKKALRFVWWAIHPPLSIREARRIHREFAGLSFGYSILCQHWRTLSPDEREFLAMEDVQP